MSCIFFFVPFSVNMPSLTSFIAHKSVSRTYFVTAQINVVKMHKIPNKSNAPPTDPAIIGIGNPSPVPSVSISRLMVT